MFSCSICTLAIKRNHSYLTCNNCKYLFHPECVSLKKEDADFLTTSNKPWTCQNCVKSMNNLQQSDSPYNATAPPLNDNGSYSTDLKHILSCLDLVRTEQSKLFDLVNNQSKKLDLLDIKFTRVLTELSELKDENKILRNNVDSLVERVVSLETKQQNSVSNDDAFSEFIDRQSRSKNIVLFNVREPIDNNVNNSDISTVNLILRNSGVDIKPVIVQRLGKPNINCRPIKVTLPSISDVYKILGSTRKLKTDHTFSDIKITSDKTLKQRQHFKDLRIQLNNRLSSGEKDLTIKYIKGCPSIVSTTVQKN